MDNSHNIKSPYSQHIYIRNKRYSEGILVWRARISNQTGFNGEYYARVKTKRYDTPTGGRALEICSQGRLILVSELILEEKCSRRGENSDIHKL